MARVTGPWTDEECATLFHLRDVKHWSFTRIDDHLLRSRGNAAGKYQSLKKHAAKEAGEAPADKAPAHVLIERAVRRALAPRDLTAAVFGDPLPGRSALDRRLAGEAEPEHIDRRAVQFGPRPTLAGGLNRHAMEDC